MSFQAMTWATEQELPAMTKIVLLMMANRTNHETGICYPSHSLLAKECGMDKRSVINQIAKLEAYGLLKVIRSKNDAKMNDVNKYILNINVKYSPLVVKDIHHSIERDSPGGSERDSPGVVQEIHQGSERDSPGVVQEIHQGSARDSLGGSERDSPKPGTIEPVIEPKYYYARGEKNTQDKSDSDLSILAEFGICGDLAKDFIKHRKAKRAPITSTAIDCFLREAVKSGITLSDAVRVSIERNWQGFNSHWYKNISTSNGNYHGKKLGISEADWNSVDF